MAVPLNRGPGGRQGPLQELRRLVARPLLVPTAWASAPLFLRRGLGCSQKQRRFVAPPLCVGDGGSSESWFWGAPGAASRAAAFGSAPPACANFAEEEEDEANREEGGGCWPPSVALSPCSYLLCCLCQWPFLLKRGLGGLKKQRRFAAPPLPASAWALSIQRGPGVDWGWLKNSGVL